MQREFEPLVTIGMPTYNRADKSLRTALESALGQTYANLEIIISDNCSTDNTEAVIRSYDDARIRYVKHEKNIGPANNFNYCANAASGEFFQLFHDDDQIDPDFIETCIDAIQYRRNIGFVHTGARLIDAEGAVTSEHANVGTTPAAKGYFLDWFAGRSTQYLCSTLYNTKALQKIGGFNSKRQLLQDVFACASLAVSNDRIAVPDIKASFRRHDNNYSSSVDYLGWCDDSLALMDMISELLPDDAEELRAAGMPFLCRMNYLIVSRIRSPLKRLYGYLRVARYFDFAASPYRYAMKREVRPGLRKLKRRFS